jgi:DNA polymerase-3 subunit delta'
MLIGHQKQWQFLKKSFELGKISHAYLFFGQEKLGKKTLAFEFIKLLNCQNPNYTQKPCQKCRNCQEIQKSILSQTEQHPDLAIIQPGDSKNLSSKEEIQISQIRDLIWRLSLKPFSAPFKAAIIDKAHLMNQEAQSCFLKTLEEPKGNAALILITEYPEMLLPTILSRVQKIKFYPVPTSEIENFLMKKGTIKSEAQGLAKLAFGRPGLALDLLLKPELLKNRKQIFSDISKMISPKVDLVSRFDFAKNLSSEPKEVRQTLEIWLDYFRDILISSIKKDKDYPMAKLKNIIRNIQNTIFLLSTTNINPRLALEVLLIDL